MLGHNSLLSSVSWKWQHISLFSCPLLKDQSLTNHWSHLVTPGHTWLLLRSLVLSADDKAPPLAGLAAAITDPGGEGHAALVRPPAVEAEVVDVVAELADVLVQALPFL